MAEQKQDDQLEHTYSSYVRIWDVALKTCQRRWTIGRSGERGSGIFVLAARHDDDDDDDIRRFCFQIIDTVKQCTMCQPSNNHDTTSHNRYLPQLELLQSCDRCSVNLYIPKYYKLLTHCVFFLLNIMTFVKFLSSFNLMSFLPK